MCTFVQSCSIQIDYELYLRRIIEFVSNYDEYMLRHVCYASKKEINDVEEQWFCLFYFICK